VRYNLTQGAVPAEPVTLAEARLHLRIADDLTADDALITALIQAAREWVENHCRRSLVQRSLVLKMDYFPGCFKLPRGEVRSVTSVQYVDQDGNTATVSSADYQVDTASEPGRIVPQLGVVWPVPKFGAINSVIVNYVAGYAEGAGSPSDYAANIPAAVKAAMKLIVGHLYEHRESIAPMALFEVPMAVKSLLAPYEIRDFELE